MERITIIGLGLIGGSIGLALGQAALPGVEIVGHDRNPEAGARARKRGAITRAEWNLIAAVERASVVIIATPVNTVREVFAQIAADLPEGCIVTDTASTKQCVMEWAKELLPSHVSFVGGHPMAGRETAGVDAADAGLFRGSTYCLTPSESAAPAAVDTMVGLVKLIGAEPYFIEPAEHDAFVAGISHLPILLSTALVTTTTSAPTWREMARLAATGYRDISRLASGDPVMHRDILETNNESITRWLDAFIQELQDYRDLIANHDEHLLAKLEEAQKARNDWLQQRSGQSESRIDIPSLREEIASLFIGRRFLQRTNKPPRA